MFFTPYLPRVAKKFKVNPRDTLLELSKRKIMGGQEDVIIDVAFEISKKILIDF